MRLFRVSSDLDPFSGLLRLQEELERVFERPSGVDLGLSGQRVLPPVDVFRDDEGFVVQVELPGLAPESVAIEALGRTLTISGSRDTSADGKASFHRRERWSGEFSRSFQIPPDLDPSKAEAAYRQGILTVRIPRSEEVKPRRITVQAS